MSPKTADISVVIVTYNSENDIKNCIESLLRNQKSGTFELFLVDNASQDQTVSNSKKLFATYKSQQFRFHLISNQSNSGFTAALNQGLEQCKGRYVLVLNPDAFLEDNCIDALLNTFKADSEAGVVAPQLLNFDGTVQPSCRRFPRRRDLLYEILGFSYLFPKSRFNSWKMGDFDHLHRRLVEQPQGACLFFPKKVLDEVGLWDEGFPMFFSDVDWCARVVAGGFKIIFEPAAKAVHKKGASIYRNRSNMIISSHKSFMRYLKKYRQHFILVNQFFAIILGITALIRVILYKAVTFLKLRAMNAE